MKSKQTLAVGDSVRVIKPSSHYLFKEGFIEKKGDVYDWEVSIDDETQYYDNKDLQLITPKKEVKKWKYSREEIVKLLIANPILSSTKSFIEMRDILLAKQSTPKKKSKEIKEIDWNGFLTKPQWEQTSILVDTINLLIKNK